MKLTIIIVLAIVTMAYAGECRRDIVIGGAPCERDFDCGTNFDYGKCRNSTCVCARGYYNADCSYPAKKALDTGLLGLTLLAGIPGIPALSVGDLQWGLPQLLMGVPFLIGGIIGSVFLCMHKVNGASVGVTIAFVVLAFLAYGAGCTWTLADAIMYGTKATGHSCDGNGYPLI
ncbi:hypothetical protein D5b_00200 [Faustovirus]|nr:hypothetical protein D5b_00200 [Faustovirus]AMN84714.1 hypothetical protein D6_00311 [Faustovirus]AMP44154.1 hypothetical protein PRJ_Dakar_00198 [Faustovirus]